MSRSGDAVAREPRTIVGARAGTAIEVRRDMRILILYASEHGQTEAVAASLAIRLERAGHDVDIFESRQHRPDPGDYDAVIIGSRIEMEKPARRIRRYVQEHRFDLTLLPTAFFTVSMSATRDAGRPQARACAERFLRQTGWEPRWIATLGGGLPYRKYGVLLRWLMKRIAAANHGPVDTTRNHDLTDWDEVARFGDRIAAGLGATEAPTARLSIVPDGIAGRAVS